MGINRRLPHVEVARTSPSEGCPMGCIAKEAKFVFLGASVHVRVYVVDHERGLSN